MDLILWRHAEAFDALPGGTDLERALTPRGHDQAERVGRWLDRHLPHGTRVLVSPAVRTQQTAQGLGRPYETSAALLSGASVQAVLDAAGWPHAPAPVLVVGHQPTLGMVAGWLMSGHRQHWSVSKGAFWWLRSEHRHHAMLVAMRTPEWL